MNMKHIILLLILLQSISSYAQKLNSLGEKMISSLHLIENIYGDKQDIKINYTYDSNNRLLSETYYSVYYAKRVKEIRTRVGNEIKIKSFVNGKPVAGYSSGFHLNDSGLIDKGWIYSTSGKERFKTYTWYEYKEGLLSKVTRRNYGMNKGVWEGSSDMSHIIFDYKDGDCYWAEMWSSDYTFDGSPRDRKYYGGDEWSPDSPYSSRINDTNVNLNLFFYMPSVWPIYLSGEESEFATEWVGMKSKHIMRSSKYFTVESKIDSCGNITEITGQNRESGWFRKLSITYIQ